MPARRDAGRDDDRGQFVLLAGVVVALALVAMLAAFLQLGVLERATHSSARSLRGAYAWGERGQAVTAFREGLDPRLADLQRSGATEGVVYHAAYNRTVATRWAAANCPGGGPDRAFGACEVDRGVVVQERAGRTLVLAAAYDLTVTTDDAQTNATFVVTTTD
ncbi:hypothetical protein BRC70_06985 [Halobacteriales archaeon QH_6_68_27]|nr:MAG: hypothetical protein BRC70_06985 [Halobacteriales archaeon QH_6_68_27]